MPTAVDSRMVSIVCNGVALGVRVPPELSEMDLADLLPPGASRTMNGNHQCDFSVEMCPQSQLISRKIIVRRGHRPISKELDIHAGLRLLRKHIQIYVAEMSPDMVFIHAGVAVYDGVAIICPGPSFAGKSTLIWSLVQAGAIYYSDEFAILDPDGRVHPFPVPLCLRGESGTRRTIAISPSSSEQNQSFNSGLLLFAEYAKGSDWQPRELSPGLAALELLRNAVAVRRNPSQVMCAVRRVAVNMPALAGKRGDAESVVRWVVSKQLATPRQ